MREYMFILDDHDVLNSNVRNPSIITKNTYLLNSVWLEYKCLEISYQEMLEKCAKILSTTPKTIELNESDLWASQHVESVRK